MIKDVLLILLILLFIFIFYHLIFDRTIYVTVDGEEFLVRYIPNETEEDRYEMAKMLSTLVKRGDEIVKYMYANNIPNPEVCDRLHSRWKNLRSKPWGIRETSILSSMVAFTAFKNFQMRTCLRNKQGKKENLNTAMFVLLHEMAHVMSEEYGHDEEFSENFAIITNVAIERNLYSYRDYRKEPIEFCNMEINTVSIN